MKTYIAVIKVDEEITLTNAKGIDPDRLEDAVTHEFEWLKESGIHLVDLKEASE